MTKSDQVLLYVIVILC